MERSDITGSERSQNIWKSAIGQLIEKELIHRGINCQQLTQRLKQQGNPQSQHHLEQQIKTGRLSAGLLLEILQTLRITTINTAEIKATIEQQQQAMKNRPDD